MNPDDSIATRESLLERLKHWSDQTSWQTFFNRYWRFIYNVARRAGLNDAEAQDVVQETVLSVARNIEGFRYDPKVCSFKTWMLRVTRWRILKHFERRQREQQILGPASDEPMRAEQVEEIPDPAGLLLREIWEEEWTKYLYEAALEEVKKKTSATQVQIFELHVRQEWPVQDVARSLGVSRARVYLAKHRVARLLRKEIQRLEHSESER